MPAGDSVDCCTVRMKTYIANAMINNINIIFLEDVFISVFIGFHIMPRKLNGFFYACKLAIGNNRCVFIVMRYKELQTILSMFCRKQSYRIILYGR